MSIPAVPPSSSPSLSRHHDHGHPPHDFRHQHHPLVVTGVLALGPLALTTSVVADTVHVGPGESIQAAIDDPSTVAGDVVLVAAGTYVETIDLRGKAITLRAADGPVVTAIDGTGAGSVVTCRTGEGPATIVEGFTITGGTASGGAGWHNLFASPTIRDCFFIDNHADFEGGGILNESSHPVVIDCRFLGNTGLFGGAVSNIDSRPLIVNCLFSGNVALNGEGGAIDHLSGADAMIVNCSFTLNSAAAGGAITSTNSSPSLSNCVLWNDDAAVAGDEVMATGPAMPVFHHCDIAGSGGSAGWNPMLGEDGGGNIDADPRFVDPLGPDGVPGTTDDDPRPGTASALIDAGDNAMVPASVWTDLSGAPRFLDDPTMPDTGAGAAPVVDLGAYERQVAAALALALDIKPRACPNVIGVRRRGELPVALLGTAEIDVESIDRASLGLARADGVGSSVAPRLEKRRGKRKKLKPNWRIRDVAMPVPGHPCLCQERDRDGIRDLVLRFRNRDLVDDLRLRDEEPGTELELIVTGRLEDGTAFESRDCVVVGRPSQDCPTDLNGDGYVDANDMLMVFAAWGVCPDCPEDLNGDGIADMTDALKILRSWGMCP